MKKLLLSVIFVVGVIVIPAACMGGDQTDATQLTADNTVQNSSVDTVENTWAASETNQETGAVIEPEQLITKEDAVLLLGEEVRGRRKIADGIRWTEDNKSIIPYKPRMLSSACADPAEFYAAGQHDIA